jgi:predicted O-methyltransferase YrrM
MCKTLSPENELCKPFFSSGISFMNPSLLLDAHLLDKQKPWRSYDLPPRHVVPTMLSELELQLLRWSTHHYFQGEGEIIDAGSFLGGSTVAMAEGLSLNPIRSQQPIRIHSFDRFTLKPEELTRSYITPYKQITQAGNFRAAYEENIRPVQDLVEVEEGDLGLYHWDGRPIELLFVDVAKTALLNEHLLREFFTCLIPGKSLLIHQDFLWCETPWIPLSMYFLRDYFEILDDMAHGTRLYRCIKRVPLEKVKQFSYANLTQEEAETAFTWTQETMSVKWLHWLFLNKARYYKDHGLPQWVVPTLAEALTLDTQYLVQLQIMEQIIEWFPEEMTGPDWLEPAIHCSDPAFRLISQITSAESGLLFSLVQALEPARVLEIGRSRGGSTFVIASALKTLGSGRLYSVDPNNSPEHRISPHLKTRLAPWVDFFDDYSPFVLPHVEEQAGGKFDFGFIDGDHSRDALERDIRGCLPHLMPGAYLLLHDAHYAGVQEAVAACLAQLPLQDRGSLSKWKYELLKHVMYNNKPSMYAGLRLLQYVPPEYCLYEHGMETGPESSELEKLREENSRLRRALVQNLNVTWTGPNR